MTFLALSASGMFIPSENRPIYEMCCLIFARLGHNTFKSTEMKYNLMSVISLSRLGVGGDLKSGDGLEVHHLQHLLGLSVNLNDVILKKSKILELEN